MNRKLNFGKERSLTIIALFYFIILCSDKNGKIFFCSNNNSFVEWTRKMRFDRVGCLVWGGETLMPCACWIKQRKKKGSNHLLRSTWTSLEPERSNQATTFFSSNDPKFEFSPFSSSTQPSFVTLTTFPPIDFYDQHFTVKLIKRILILLISGLRRLKPNQLFFNSSSRINFDGFAFSLPFQIFLKLLGSSSKCEGKETLEAKGRV